MKKASLSFHLRVVTTPRQLDVVCGVRAASYGHHLPELIAHVGKPDDVDTKPGVVVLLCTDKATGRGIGTARLQTNAYVPLLIEGSVSVPSDLVTKPRAEIARLSVVPGGDPLAKLAMMKACFMLCIATQTRRLIIGARSASLARQYERLGFVNLYEDRRMVPLAHAGGIPHMILVAQPMNAQQIWRESHAALHDFTFQTFHPDIQLFAQVFAQEERDAALVSQLPAYEGQPEPCEPGAEPERVLQRDVAAVVVA